MSNSLTILFAGTPDFAARHLEALLASEHNVVGVLTQPDRPAGRGNKIATSPVKCLAQQHGIPLFQPTTLRSPQSRAQIAAFNADIMVVVAYGLILPVEVLTLFRLGCINVHGSLLPRWRGAAPIQRAIWAGDEQSGITIMQMDAGLDTGDILHKQVCPIEAQETSATLYNRLAQIGPRGLLTTLSELAQGTIRPEKQQDNEATYAKKLSKEEARLNWLLPATQLERCIRAFNPWPVSYLIIHDLPVKIWQATVLPHQPGSRPGEVLRADKHGLHIATVQGILNIHRLQPAGARVMSVQDCLNARRDWFTPGTILA